jgi:hypothetical protein
MAKRLAAQGVAGDLAPNLKMLALAANFCRNAAGTEYRIRVSGRAVNLEGFGFPESGRMAIFDEGLDTLVAPIVPLDSSGTGPLGTLFSIDGDGSWNVNSDYRTCQGTSHPLTVMVWFRYLNSTSEHMCIEGAELPSPTCAALAGLPAC